MSIAEKLITVAENESKVYEAGEKAEHDKFWDAYQENGERLNYQNAFCDRWWNDKNFKPKYDIKPTTATAMFDRFGGEQNKQPITVAYDLAEMLNSCGVVLDLSKAIGMNNLCYYSCISHFPTLDVTSCNSQIIGVFGGCTRLTKIDKIILKNDGSTIFKDFFVNCYKLVDVEFEGVIGQNGFNVSASPLLTHDSLMSIINALKDFKEYTTVTKTFSNGEGSINTLTEGTLVEGQEYTWSFYCAEYPGWLVNDMNTPPTDTQTTITSIAEQITVDGNTYIGFKAETDYWPVWGTPYARAYTVCVYQDGTEIKVYRSDPFSGDIINLSIDKPTETRTITLGTTNLGKLTDAEKAIATEKGWTLV